LFLLSPVESSVFILSRGSYELGKHHRGSFPSRVNNHSSSAFELVHSDIWGRCRVPSFKGFRYFLLFVNDFSRITWFYLLTEISEIFGVIKLFLMKSKINFLHLFVPHTDNQGSKYRYRDRIGWGFFISDIGGDIGDTRAYWAFISDTIYNEISITKSWFRVIDIIYLIKMM